VRDSQIFLVESKEELMVTPLPEYPKDLETFAHHVAGEPPSGTLASSLATTAMPGSGDGYYDTHRAWCIRTLQGRLEFWATWAKRYMSFVWWRFLFHNQLVTNAYCCTNTAA
jgi:hypothetical protein